MLYIYTLFSRGTVLLMQRSTTQEGHRLPQRVFQDVHILTRAPLYPNDSLQQVQSYTEISSAANTARRLAENHDSSSCQGTRISRYPRVSGHKTTTVSLQRLSCPQIASDCCYGEVVILFSRVGIIMVTWFIFTATYSRVRPQHILRLGLHCTFQYPFSAVSFLRFPWHSRFRLYH